jgi:hypothetical protein
LCFQRSPFAENYPNMILGDEPLLSQGGVLSQLVIRARWGANTLESI